MSSDSCGAKPRPIPIDKVHACARKTTALTEPRPPGLTRCSIFGIFVACDPSISRFSDRLCRL